MTEQLIEEVVARCLLDPSFIDAVRAKPQDALAPYKFDELVQRELEDTDFERIKLFSGFICKVQFNHLWESFPATRRLLRVYEIELEVFVSFRPQQLLPEWSAMSRDERTGRFLSFLESDLLKREITAAEFLCLREVLKHERAIWEVRTALTRPASDEHASVQPNVSQWSSFQRLIPSTNGPLRICRFELDPEAVISGLQKGTFNRGLPGRKRRDLVYWGDRESRSLRMLEPDSLSLHVLAQITGTRTVRAVIAAVRRNGLEHVSPAAFRGFFEQAAQVGIIRLIANGV